jgi:hypothetical protein
VLDEDADEALERAIEGAMDDVQIVLGIVGADVREAERARHLRVELDRPHLPRAAERVVMCRSIFGRRTRRRPR